MGVFLTVLALSFSWSAAVPYSGNIKSHHFARASRTFAFEGSAVRPIMQGQGPPYPSDANPHQILPPLQPGYPATVYYPHASDPSQPYDPAKPQTYIVPQPTPQYQYPNQYANPQQGYHPQHTGIPGQVHLIVQPAPYAPPSRDGFWGPFIVAFIISFFFGPSALCLSCCMHGRRSRRAVFSGAALGTCLAGIGYFILGAHLRNRCPSVECYRYPNPNSDLQVCEYKNCDVWMYLFGGIGAVIEAIALAMLITALVAYRRELRHPYGGPNGYQHRPYPASQPQGFTAPIPVGGGRRSRSDVHSVPDPQTHQPQDGNPSYPEPTYENHGSHHTHPHAHPEPSHAHHHHAEQSQQHHNYSEKSHQHHHHSEQSHWGGHGHVEPAHSEMAHTSDYAASPSHAGTAPSYEAVTE
ncbi:uncharacterized protein EV422DRAFT_541773 [Fimicolochytrium jonesii]|uniref:uncharacterized protein n=1 Tax=Fimicolochytrium jonesii TaxID=1396493 RepID=UPI0022FE1B25|nr:uncharacterized protein EV422DRAFT_541773 [Fimicolochytrium jonesii]KAI8817433.1 hypothetical protein EV422DRAFT_541773 [Fimicolochytrium jonesii]